MKSVFLAFLISLAASTASASIRTLDSPATSHPTAGAAQGVCTGALRDRWDLFVDRTRVFILDQIRRSKMLIQGRYPHHAQGFYSQNGQDQWLAQSVFYNRGNGSFVEIGAHDGVEFSNTYYFEKEKRWKGLCVEPVPSSYAKLKENRKCTAVHAAISPTEGTIPFLEINVPDDRADGVMLSGIASKYASEHVDRIQREVAQFEGQANTINVPSYHLQTLLDQNRLNVQIDYLSVDTEGSELDVLKTIDFSRTSISVISVENNYGDIEVRRFLESKGYRRVNRIGKDDFYFASDFTPTSKR
jgi:FkbM family methyltransferase